MGGEGEGEGGGRGGKGEGEGERGRERGEREKGEREMGEGEGEGRGRGGREKGGRREHVNMSVLAGDPPKDTCDYSTHNSQHDCSNIPVESSAGTALSRVVVTSCPRRVNLRIRKSCYVTRDAHAFGVFSLLVHLL